MKNIFSRLSPLKIFSLLFCLAIVLVIIVLMQPHQTNSITPPSSNGIDLLAQNWAYMPATVPSQKQLDVAAADFRIVQQDGTGGQSNPPLNLYGTHIVGTDNFELLATFERVYGDCSLQLYDQPPRIADEFRVESTSLRITTTPPSLLIQFWNNAQKTKSQTVKVSGNHIQSISVQRSGNTFFITSNGKVVAIIKGAGEFSSGKIWLGIDSTNQGCKVSKLRVIPSDADKLSVVDQSKQHFTQTGTGLQSLINKFRPSFKIGAAMALGPMVADATYQNEALDNFGSMTPENAMKWQFIEPKQGMFTYQEADALVTIAGKNGLKVHGHTLVFGEANPRWVSDLPYGTSTQKMAVKQVMVNHIANVVSHYKNTVDSWDVVNEPLADYDNFDVSSGQILRDSIWYRALGADYISEAFKATHKANPDADLYMNEYGLEQDGERWDSFFALVKSLKNAGVPIDGVGFQAHVYEASDKIDSAILASHINQLAELGIKSRISEMDVYNDIGTALQAQQYNSVFSMCLSNTHCTGFTTWGVDDAYDMFLEDNQVEYGHDLLFNHGQATPAFMAIHSQLLGH